MVSLGVISTGCQKTHKRKKGVYKKIIILNDSCDLVTQINGKKTMRTIKAKSQLGL